MFQLCCRACLEQTKLSEMRSLFETYKGFVIRDTLFELFQIEVNQTDVLSFICHGCLSKVYTVLAIRKEFINNDRTYREIIIPAGTTWDHSQLEKPSEREPSTSKSLPRKIKQNCGAISEQSRSQIEGTSVGSDTGPLFFVNEEQLKEHNFSCHGTYSVESETNTTDDGKLVSEAKPSVKQKRRKIDKQAETSSFDIDGTEEDGNRSITSCHISKITFATSSKLLQHCRLVHQEEFKKYQCAACSEQFTSKTTLIEHYKTSYRHRRFQCRYCSKWLPTQVALKGHENVHTRKKTYSCSVCDRKFAQYTSMRRHMKIHDDIKSHECDFCQVRFRQRSVMMAHRRRHTGGKPYSCDLCEKTFRVNSALSKHKRIHTL